MGHRLVCWRRGRVTYLCAGGAGVLLADLLVVERYLVVVVMLTELCDLGVAAAAAAAVQRVHSVSRLAAARLVHVY